MISASDLLLWVVMIITGYYALRSAVWSLKAALLGNDFAEATVAIIFFLGLLWAHVHIVYLLWPGIKQ